jgi:hypothetical protein
MTTRLAQEFNFHDELQMLCEPVWQQFPKLTVQEASSPRCREVGQGPPARA